MAIKHRAIECRVGPEGEWHTIPASQQATLLSFLDANRRRRLVWDDLYRAMGSHEVGRALNGLRKRGIAVRCDMEGRIGVYSLPDEVEVRQPPPRDAEEDEA